MHLKALWDSWYATASLWDAVKFWLPTLLSIFTAYFVFKDRIPRLKLVQKKGKWCVLRKMENGEISFEGVIEVYNASSRANAIRNYEYFYNDYSDKKWRLMESEHFFVGEKVEGEKPHTIREYNKTPISLGPYSALEINVQGLAKMKPPYTLLVKIIIEDLFGRKYTLQVNAEME